MLPSKIITEANDAYAAAAIREFKAQGSVDCGACGDFMLILDGRSKVAKAAVSMGYGIALGGGIAFQAKRPEGVRTQSADVWQAAGRAAKAVFEKYGVRISRSWSYID